MLKFSRKQNLPAMLDVLLIKVKKERFFFFGICQENTEVCLLLFFLRSLPFKEKCYIYSNGTLTNNLGSSQQGFQMGD